LATRNQVGRAFFLLAKKAGKILIKKQFFSLKKVMAKKLVREKLLLLQFVYFF